VDIRGAFGCLTPSVTQIREMIGQLQMVCDDLKWPESQKKSESVYLSDHQTTTFVTNRQPITSAYIKDCNLIANGDHPSSLVKTLERVHTVNYLSIKSKIIYPLLCIKPLNVMVHGCTDSELDLHALFNTDTQKRLRHPSGLFVYCNTLSALPQSISLLNTLSIKTRRLSPDVTQSLISIPSKTLQQLSLHIEHESPSTFIQQLVRNSPATTRLELYCSKPQRWTECTEDKKHSAPVASSSSSFPKHLILSHSLSTPFICSREWLHYDMSSLSRLELVMDDSKCMTRDRQTLWWKIMISRATRLESIRLTCRTSSNDISECVLIALTAVITSKQSIQLEVVIADAKCQLQLSELILHLFGNERYQRLQNLLTLCHSNLETYRHPAICALKCESLLALMTNQPQACTVFNRRMESLGGKSSEDEKALASYSPLDRTASIDSLAKIVDATAAPTLSISPSDKKQKWIVCFPYF